MKQWELTKSSYVSPAEIGKGHLSIHMLIVIMKVLLHVHTLRWTQPRWQNAARDVMKGQKGGAKMQRGILHGELLDQLAAYGI
jgi:hypothetical protein